MSSLHGLLTHDHTVSQDRTDWHYTRITTPRPSCLPTLQRKNALRNMFPGDVKILNGHEVRRILYAGTARQWKVDGKLCDLDTALARLAVAGTGANKRGQLYMPLELEGAA